MQKIINNLSYVIDPPPPSTPGLNGYYVYNWALFNDGNRIGSYYSNEAPVSNPGEVFPKTLIENTTSGVSFINTVGYGPHSVGVINTSYYRDIIISNNNTGEIYTQRIKTPSDTRRHKMTLDRIPYSSTEDIITGICCTDTSTMWYPAQEYDPLGWFTYNSAFYCPKGTIIKYFEKISS
jgi:hypothetical protein